VLDGELGHGEVIDVRSRERGLDAHGRSSDQAVGLMERGALDGEVAPPATGTLALGDTEGGEPEGLDEPSGNDLLVWPQPPPDLLDRDRAHPRLDAPTTEARHPGSSRPSAKGVDDHRGVEEKAGHSASSCSTLVAASLSTNPASRVVIPRVSFVGKLPEARLDLVPTAFVIEAATDELGDEGTPPPTSRPPVELGHQLVVESYVQTHVLSLAHMLSTDVLGSSMKYSAGDMGSGSSGEVTLSRGGAFPLEAAPAAVRRVSSS
jgi:hypothetical protein